MKPFAVLDVNTNDKTDIDTVVDLVGKKFPEYNWIVSNSVKSLHLVSL